MEGIYDGMILAQESCHRCNGHGQIYYPAENPCTACKGSKVILRRLHISELVQYIKDYEREVQS